MLRTIEKVWEEDLQVEVCYGGYPGIPNREVQPSGVCPPALLTTPHVLGRATDFPPQRLHRIHLEDTEVVLFYYQGHYVALEGICPHSGGILSLGRVEQNCLICPWHGAKFDVITGENLCKTAHRPLQTYQVREEEGVLNLYPVVNIESAESE